MAVLRFLAILALALAFVVVGLPLDSVARRFGFGWRKHLPLLFHRTLVRILRIRIEIRGQMAASPALIIPNHVSWTDISVIGALKPLSFVAKKDVAGWPLFGSLARAQGSVFVDRNRRMKVHDTNLEMADRLLQGRSVVLFPEGTTGDGHRLLHLRTSQFAAVREALRQNPALGFIAVQPVSISYQRRQGLIMDRGARAAVAWYGDTDLLPHVWDLLRNGPLQVVLTFAEPLACRIDTDRKVLARHISAILRQMNYDGFYGRGGEINLRHKMNISPELNSSGVTQTTPALLKTAKNP